MTVACEICGETSCDGLVFATPKPIKLIPESKGPPKVYRTCRTKHKIIEDSESFTIEWTMGHGCSFGIEVVPEDTNA